MPIYAIHAFLLRAVSTTSTVTVDSGSTADSAEGTADSARCAVDIVAVIGGVAAAVLLSLRVTL